MERAHPLFTCDHAARKTFGIPELLVMIAHQLDSRSLWKLTQSCHLFQKQILKERKFRQTLYLEPCDDERALLVEYTIEEERIFYSTSQAEHCTIIKDMEANNLVEDMVAEVLRVFKPVSVNNILPNLKEDECWNFPGSLELRWDWKGVEPDFKCLDMLITQPKTTALMFYGGSMLLENQKGIRLRDIFEAFKKSRDRKLKMTFPGPIEAVIERWNLLEEMGHYVMTDWRNSRNEKAAETEALLEKIADAAAKSKPRPWREKAAWSSKGRYLFFKESYLMLRSARYKAVSCG